MRTGTTKPALTSWAIGTGTTASSARGLPASSIPITAVLRGAHRSPHAKGQDGGKLYSVAVMRSMAHGLPIEDSPTVLPGASGEMHAQRVEEMPECQSEHQGLA